MIHELDLRRHFEDQGLTEAEIERALDAYEAAHPDTGSPDCDGSNGGNGGSEVPSDAPRGAHQTASPRPKR